MSAGAGDKIDTNISTHFSAHTQIRNSAFSAVFASSQLSQLQWSGHAAAVTAVTANFVGGILWLVWSLIRYIVALGTSASHLKTQGDGRMAQDARIAVRRPDSSTNISSLGSVLDSGSLLDEAPMDGGALPVTCSGSGLRNSAQSQGVTHGSRPA